MYCCILQLIDMEQQYCDEILCPSIADTGQQCDNVIQHGQKFCSECGCRVSAEWFVKQTVSPQAVCAGIDEDGSVCGWQLDFSAKYCPNCGTRSKLHASGL